jgi:hypothetical protein
LNPLARLATAVPIFPNPRIPKVEPYILLPRNKSGVQPFFHLPSIKYKWPSTIFRDNARINAKVRSAVASDNILPVVVT